MSEVDNFIAAVKEKRDETLEKFSATLANQNGHLDQDDAILYVDKLVGSVLDLVEEHYSDLVSYETEVFDDGEVAVTLSIAGELSASYFEQVNS